MNKMMIKRKSCVTSFTIMLFLLKYSTSAYGEPTVINPTPNGVERLIVSPNDIRASGSLGYSNEGTVAYLTLYDNRNSKWIYSCRGYSRNKPPSTSVQSSIKGPEWDDFLQRASNDLQSCVWKKTPGYAIDWDNLRSFVLAYGTGYTEAQGNFKLSVVTERLPLVPNKPPAVCAGSITRHISFGTINIGTYPDNPASTTGSLTLQCDGNVPISLTINNGLNLHNKDGSEINLDYPRTVNVKKGDVVVTDIMALMSKPPGTPGEYEWSVPVMIQYP
ncbi:hypothetical protein EA24_09690 [Vibrio navarrensis]|nr:hypothetical protein EA24_09690 [Vibrio navarrensis]